MTTTQTKQSASARAVARRPKSSRRAAGSGAALTARENAERGFRASEQLSESLQRVLVDLIELGIQGKQAHWNVVGKNFRDTHKQLDEVIAATRRFSDTIAERMRALHALPDGRSDTVAETTTLPEFPQGEIDTTTAAGSRLRDEVTALNDEMLTAILQADESAKAQGRHGASMEEAAAAAEPYLSKLRTIAEEAGVSEPQVAALVKTMMSSPEMISFMVDDSGTVDASQIRLMDLAMQIRDAPNGEFEVTSDSFPGLMKALELLGIDITTLPDGTVKVKKDDGSFASVEEAINHVARARESLISFRVQEEWQGIPYKLPSSDSARGNLFTGGTAEAFAAGGFASGFYKAPPGQAAIHKFAESFLPWEAYISPLPGHEERNAKIAIEALRRLGFPVVPANQVYGTRAFAAGEMLANDSAPNRTQRSVGAAKTAPVSRQSRRNTGPLVGNIYLGKGATRSELDELLNVLDFYERSNR